VRKNLAPPRVNLALMEERWPDVKFRATREHHKALIGYIQNPVAKAVGFFVSQTKDQKIAAFGSSYRGIANTL
jgi:hypothetical protein